MFVSINADGKWYGIEVNYLRREDGWVSCGSECDRNGVIGRVDCMMRVKNVVSK